MDPHLHELDKTGHIDVSTFSQILEMDDDPEDRDFSPTIVMEFFEQAEQTFEKMDTELENKNLQSLSELGHFLKGSSATLGLVKVKDQCEKIQNLGARKDETGATAEPDDEKTLAKIKEIIAKARADYENAKDALSKWYGF